MKCFMHRNSEREQHCLPEPSSTGDLRARLSPLLAIIVGAALTVGLTGCQTVDSRPIALTPSYRPDNFYLAQATLPINLKRVVVLPLACNSQRASMIAGRDELGPILDNQLIDTKKFEVIRISPAELQRETGQAYWVSGDALPANFFSVLRKNYGCDAVMFCQLTEFRPYPPLDMGWRLKLVDAKTRQILWAEDEQFNAGQPAVIAGAVRYQEADQNQFGRDSTGWLTLNSPRLFGQYALAEMFSTLPPR